MSITSKLSSVALSALATSPHTPPSIKTEIANVLEARGTVGMHAAVSTPALDRWLLLPEAR